MIFMHFLLAITETLSLVCIVCGVLREFHTSLPINTNKAGRQAYEVNRRAVMAFREMGRGLTDMKKIPW